MKTSVLKFLFPSARYSASASWFLLALRLLFGGLLLSHGLAKWTRFDVLSAAFPDPLGTGHRMALGLAVFAEVICSGAFILGIFYRLALLPMIFTMAVAVFVVHGGDPFAARELAFVYLMMFVLLFSSGPGNYALDRWIGRKLTRRV